MPTLNEIYLKSAEELSIVHKRTLHFFLLENKGLLEREAKAAKLCLRTFHDKNRFPDDPYAVEHFAAAREAAMFFPSGVVVSDSDLGSCIIRFLPETSCLVVDWSRNYADS